MKTKKKCQFAICGHTLNPGVTFILTLTCKQHYRRIIWIQFYTRPLRGPIYRYTERRPMNAQMLSLFTLVGSDGSGTIAKLNGSQSKQSKCKSLLMRKLWWQCHLMLHRMIARIINVTFNNNNPCKGGGVTNLT